MTPSVRFAELLDQASGREPRRRLRSRYDARLGTLVALTGRAAAVRFTAAADPDPAFRADLRAMLVAAAEREGVGHEPAERARRRILVGASARARAAIVGGVVVGALVLSGIAAASGGAMPGDTLYGVKRSTERAELAFAGSDIDRGLLYLDFARTRLAEAESVSGSAGHLRRAMDDMDSDTREGVRLLTGAAVARKDPDVLDRVDDFVRAQQSGIGDILDKVAGASRARLLGSLDLLEQVATRSRQLRQTLSCGAAPDSGRDALGPRPGSCAPAGGSPTSTVPGGPGTARPTPTRGARGGVDPTAGPGPGEPSAAATPARPAGTGGSGHPTPAASPSATPDAGGGLIGGLRRIIGDLLGG